MSAGSQDPRRGRFAAPEWLGSVRFRLTIIYSTVLFGLAALVVGGIYLGLAATLDDESVHPTFAVEELNAVARRPGGDPQPGAGRDGSPWKRLSTSAPSKLFATTPSPRSIMLFVASLGVGWVVAGQALAPIHRITGVARQIQATDLKRRIALADRTTSCASWPTRSTTCSDASTTPFEGQRRFVHEASHELRNPLAVITTNLEVALSDPEATVEDLRRDR